VQVVLAVLQMLAAHLLVMVEQEQVVTTVLVLVLGLQQQARALVDY
jgi:hypothetical protein